MNLHSYRLQLTTVTLARQFVAIHHRHLKPPPGAKFAVALFSGNDTIGVALVGRPVARCLDDGRTVEITRLAVLDNYKNACSKLYSWCRREAHRRQYRRIITYTRADEPGTSLRASGWVVHHKVSPRSWNCPSRPRGGQEIIGKVAWVPAADLRLWS